MDLDVAEFVPAPGQTWRAGDAFLAGGTWLFSEPQPALDRLLDLRAYGWRALTVSPTGLEIAATCTLTELAAWQPPPSWPAAALARTCCHALLGSATVWNSATVGGNVCLALPAGPMTSWTAALDASCVLWSAAGDVREVPVIDFVRGPRSTVLEPGELLRAIRVPAAALRARAAFRQMSLSANGRSAAVVIGRIDESGSFVLTLTASTPRPVQVRSITFPALDAASTAIEAAGLEWLDDVHGEPRWRAAVTARLVGEICAELAGPA